jgi:hypothetical protein
VVPWLSCSVIRHPQKLIEALDELLEAPGDLESMDLSARHLVGTQLLLDFENVLRTLAESLPDGPFTYRSPLNTGKVLSCPASPRSCSVHSVPSHYSCPLRIGSDDQGPGGKRRRHSVPQPGTDGAELDNHKCKGTFRKW